MPTTRLRSALTTLEILVTYAIKAPSSHNTQPWRYRLDEPSRVLLYADRSRRLPVNDPHDRELTMSCGAALENLTIASREFGFDVDVRVLPDPAEPDLLAVVTLAQGRWPTAEEAAMFVAIDQRRTYRTPFAHLSVDAQVVRAMEAAAADEGAWLVTIDDDRRARIAALVEQGDRLQFHDPRWRRELASWLLPPRQGDGPAIPRAASFLARTVIRSVDAGRQMAIRDAALVKDAPVLVVLGTDADNARSWVAAGRALERVLLTAAFKGVQAGFLNQPCQMDALRCELQTLVEREGAPQALLRFGYPLAELPESPRRPLASTLFEEHVAVGWNRPSVVDRSRQGLTRPNGGEHDRARHADSEATVR